jgi:hypothetical protein
MISKCASSPSIIEDICGWIFGRGARQGGRHRRRLPLCSANGAGGGPELTPRLLVAEGPISPSRRNGASSAPLLLSSPNSMAMHGLSGVAGHLTIGAVVSLASRKLRVFAQVNMAQDDATDFHVVEREAAKRAHDKISRRGAPANEE